MVYWAWQKSRFDCLKKQMHWEMEDLIHWLSLLTAKWIPADVEEVEVDESKWIGQAACHSESIPLRTLLEPASWDTAAKCDDNPQVSKIMGKKPKDQKVSRFKPLHHSFQWNFREISWEKRHNEERHLQLMAPWCWRPRSNVLARRRAPTTSMPPTRWPPGDLTKTTNGNKIWKTYEKNQKIQ